VVTTTTAPRPAGGTAALDNWAQSTLNPAEQALTDQMVALGNCQSANAQDLANCEMDGYTLQMEALRFLQGTPAPDSGVQAAWHSCLEDTANIGNAARDLNVNSEQSWDQQLSSDNAALKSALARRGISDPVLG
jgi:hypothetical protein